MSLENLDHLVYLIMRIGTVAFTIIIETTFIAWVALLAGENIKKLLAEVPRWRYGRKARVNEWAGQSDTTNTGSGTLVMACLHGATTPVARKLLIADLPMSAAGSLTAVRRDADCISAESTCTAVPRLVRDAMRESSRLTPSPITLIGFITRQPIRVGPNGGWRTLKVKWLGTVTVD